VRKVFRGASADALQDWPPKHVPNASIVVTPGASHD
jgi:hypothetical protein